MDQATPACLHVDLAVKHHLSTGAMSAALIAGAVVCYIAYKLYSKWIDGQQKKHGE